MKLKKMLAVIMTAVVATGMLAGCGSSSDEKASGKEAGGNAAKAHRPGSCRRYGLTNEFIFLERRDTPCIGEYCRFCSPRYCC